MNMKMGLRVAALGLMFTSMPLVAKHDGRLNASQDRSQDYLEPKDGPTLRPDANAYLWGDEALWGDKSGNNAVAARPRSNVQLDHSNEHGHYDGHVHDHQQSYYVPAFAPMVTIISMAPVTTTTTTVTEEVYYETVRRPLRKKSAHVRKPKPRCGCR